MEDSHITVTDLKEKLPRAISQSERKFCILVQIFTIHHSTGLPEGKNLGALIQFKTSKGAGLSSYLVVLPSGICVF